MKARLTLWWRRFVVEPVSLTLTEASWFGFVLSALLIAAIVNLGTGLLAELAGAGWAAAVLVALLLGTLFFANLYAVSFKNRVAKEPRIIGNRPSPRPRRGLIVMVTPAPTARGAVAYHAGTLEHLWMIVTPKMQEEASKLRAFAESKHVRCWEVDLEDEYDAAGCYWSVRDVFETHARREGVPADEVIADMTGGTKPMTAGMVLACNDLNVSLEHVPTRFVGPDLDPTDPYRPIEVVIGKPSGK